MIRSVFTVIKYVAIIVGFYYLYTIIIREFPGIKQYLNLSTIKNVCSGAISSLRDLFDFLFDGIKNLKLV